MTVLDFIDKHPWFTTTWVLIICATAWELGRMLATAVIWRRRK
jgi:hypothetical protein